MTTPDQDLHFAAAKGDVDAMRQAIEAGANLNAQSPHMRDSALHVATMGGHLDAMRFLLDRGADPNLRNLDGRVPLHDAAFKYEKQPKIWLMLIEHGADPHVRDQFGQTPQTLRDSLVFGPEMLALSREQAQRALGFTRER